MRILANENFQRVAVEALREDGHDVAWVWEDGRGSSDAAIPERAQSENRPVATFDKDFGELAFRSRLPSSSGVILFRVSGTVEVQTRLIRLALRGPVEGAARFTTVTNERIRSRTLPAS